MVLTLIGIALGVLGVVLTVVVGVWGKELRAWWVDEDEVRSIKTERLSEQEKEFLLEASDSGAVARELGEGLWISLRPLGQDQKLVMHSSLKMLDELERDGVVERQGGHYYLTELGRRLKRDLSA